MTETTIPGIRYAVMFRNVRLLEIFMAYKKLLEHIYQCYQLLQ